MVRIAQIGVGYWGPNLLRNLVSNPDCLVGTVVDLSEGRRAFVTSLYPSIRVGTDVREVWDDSEVDAVVIATPAGSHFELVRQALAAGKQQPSNAVSFSEAVRLIWMPVMATR